MNTFSVIGGDLRSVKLAELLQKDGNTVIVNGIEKNKEIVSNIKIDLESDIKIAIEKSDIIIAPTPFSKNGEDLFTVFSDKKIKISDLYGNYSDKIFFGGNI